MKTTKLLTVLSVMVLAAASLAAAPTVAPEQPDVDAAFAQLRHYEWGHTNPAPAILNELTGRAGSDARLRADLEQRLIAMLGSDAPFAARQFACKKLALIGSAQAVPALAQLLPDREMSHVARAALERIGGAPAREALLKALPQAQGTLKAGIIASLGTLHVAECRDDLVVLVKDKDLHVARAAVVSLGQIGDANTIEALRALRLEANPALRIDIANAVLQIGFRLLDEGRRTGAAAAFAGLYTGNEPVSVQVAAFNGLLRAEPRRAAGRVNEVFRGDDPFLIRAAVNHLVGLERGRVPAEVTRSAAAFSTAGKRALLNALRARGETSDRAAIFEFIKGDEVRLEAIEALADCGTARDIPALVDILRGGEAPAKAAAVESLAGLRDRDVNERIVALLPGSDAAVRAELIHVLARRHATETLGSILAYKDDPGTRLAVVGALGALGTEERIPALVGMYEAAGDDDRFRAAVENALVSICDRRREACLPAILAKIENVGAETHGMLLGLLPSIGNDTALATVRSAAASNDAQLRDAAVRQLADWPDAAAIPDLQRVLQTTSVPIHHSLALRGLVRLVTDAIDLPEPSKLAALKDAMTRSSGVNDKRMILSGLSSLGSVEALEYVVGLLDDLEVRPEVQSAVLQIARRSRAQDEAATRALLEQAIGRISDTTVIERMRAL